MTIVGYLFISIDIAIVRVEYLLMLGVINNHCGRVLAAKSLSNKVKFLILARRFGSEFTES